MAHPHFLPPFSYRNIQVFRTCATIGGGSINAGYQLWVKPRGVSWINFFLLGCGGNGGAGATNSMGTVRGGGGGGGSGNVYNYLASALMFPDSIGVLVPAGGSLIATTLVYPPTQNIAPNLGLVIATATFGGNGSPGGGAGGGGGNGPTVPVAIKFLQRAFYTGVAGSGGGSGGSTNQPADPSYGGDCSGPGGGGGGTGAANANNNGANAPPLSGPGSGAVGPWGFANGGSGAGGNGDNGYDIWLPDGSFFFSIGGAGGASNGTGTGGNGGNGGLGSGGGGGGGGVTGGSGGLGGNGLVIITCW